MSDTITELKKRGRKPKYATAQEKVDAQRQYNKQYYETKSKDPDGNYKYKKTRPQTITNAIARITRDDKYIEQFVETVGRDKILKLLIKN